MRFHKIIGHMDGRCRAIMRFNNRMRHTDGRSRDIYGAPGWGNTRSNFLIFIKVASASA